MQTPKLPIQLNANPGPVAPSRAAQNGSDAAQFSAALSREVDQRQQKSAMPAPAPAKTPPPAKAEQSKPAAKAADKPADKAPAKADENGAAKASETDTTRAASGKEEGADAAAAQTAADAAAAAAAGAPALDMLALVASLNLPGAAVPAAVAAPQATDGALPSAATGIGSGGGKAGAGTANMMGQLDGKVLDVAAPMATDGGSPLGQPVERVVADAAPVTAQADPATAQPKGLTDFAALGARVRETQADPAAIKDLGVSAPTAAPVQQASLTLAQAAAGVATDKIAARVGTPGWDQQVGQKVVWMVAGKEQSASLTLNPPDMGPMQVVLSVTNDQATVTFSAHQPEVRQALEDAMPKLRDMLGESGIALGNASVNDGSARQQAEAQAREAGRGRGNGRDGGQGGGAVETQVTTVPRRGSSAQGMVDTFA